MEDLLKQSCLDYNELDSYLQGEKGTDIHINNLVIFDKPIKLEKLKVRKNDCPFPCGICNVRYCRLTKAPQSWCYIEI